MINALYLLVYANIDPNIRSAAEATLSQAVESQYVCLLICLLSYISIVIMTFIRDQLHLRYVKSWQMKQALRTVVKWLACS